MGDPGGTAPFRCQLAQPGGQKLGVRRVELLLLARAQLHRRQDRALVALDTAAKALTPAAATACLPTVAQFMSCSL